MEPLERIAEKTRQAYNLAAERYHDLFHDELGGKPSDRRLLDRFAGRYTPSSVICDAGCGPSAHIGRYLLDKRLQVIGVDISDRCVELARRHNPCMHFALADIANLPFPVRSLDGIIAYYSIIDTPREYAGRIFDEFFRVLRPGGSLLVAAKEGSTEGYVDDLLGMKTEIYFTLFTEGEIAGYFERAGFTLELLETRSPYEFEIRANRVFAIGSKRRT